MDFDINKLKWTRDPKEYTADKDKIEVITSPKTDLWQRTYYHFRNDNAPVLQMETDEKYFSFVVKTEFDTKVRYDQSGIVMYLDSENWLKAAMEKFAQKIGATVTIMKDGEHWFHTEEQMDFLDNWIVENEYSDVEKQLI